MSTTRVISEFTKHPGSTIDIDFRLVSSDADTIDTVDAIVISPAGLSSPTVTISGATAKVWLTSGVNGVDYSIEVPMNTHLGRREIGLAIVKVRA